VGEHEWEIIDTDHSMRANLRTLGSSDDSEAA
jgi:hypothetical protein